MDIEIYCDESRQEHFYTSPPVANQYVLIGGIWIEANKRHIYKEKIKTIREIHNVMGEFKWKRVSPSKIDFYFDLVNLFFEESIRFRCIVLPTEHLNVVKFHDNDHELMFYKFYYQFIVHWLNEFTNYRIFLDLKTNRIQNRIKSLKRILKFANPAANILDVQSLPSDQLDLLQLADLFIGAVGYKFHGLKNSESKLALIKKIEEHLKHPIEPTSRDIKKFNIFKFTPSRRW